MGYGRGETMGEKKELNDIGVENLFLAVIERTVKDYYLDCYPHFREPLPQPREYQYLSKDEYYSLAEKHRKARATEELEFLQGPIYRHRMSMPYETLIEMIKAKRRHNYRLMDGDGHSSMERG